MTTATATCYRQLDGLIQAQSGWVICPEKYEGLCCQTGSDCLDEQICNNPKNSGPGGSGYYIGLCTVLRTLLPTVWKLELTIHHRTQRTRLPPAPPDALTIIGETSPTILVQTCGLVAGRTRLAITQQTRRSLPLHPSSCSLQHPHNRRQRRLQPAFQPAFLVRQ